MALSFWREINRDGHKLAPTAVLLTRGSRATVAITMVDAKNVGPT